MGVPRDRYLLFASAALRACAVSFSGVILALYLSALGWNPLLIGLTVSLGLSGAALATFVVMTISKHARKKTLLILIPFLMAFGGLAFTFSKHTPVLMISALLGMLNGMGRDRGASMTLEQALLPRTTADMERTRIFAWYNVLIDAGHAAGAFLGILPALFRSHGGLSSLSSYAWSWGVYSMLCLLSGALLFGFSEPDGPEETAPKKKLSSASRSIIAKFAGLSAIDSLGGGFLTTAMIGFWFFKRFGADESMLAPLFFFARLANILSHFGAAWLAKRIGLVNTMVFTHIPSSLLLMTVPFMPNLTIAAILFLIRESLVEMDVPTRQSYIVAVVKPEERVQAAGITNLTKTAAWGVAPAFAGSISGLSLSLPIVIGPALKILYDILLYREFRHIKPPEEVDGLVRKRNNGRAL